MEVSETNPFIPSRLKSDLLLMNSSVTQGPFREVRMNPYSEMWAFSVSSLTLIEESEFVSDFSAVRCTRTSKFLILPYSVNAVSVLWGASRSAGLFEGLT